MNAKTVTIKQIQRLDEVAIKGFGVPSLALMENAGRAVACEALKFVKNKKAPVVTVVCGLGNNAGDGFVAARHLLNAGIETNIYLIGNPSKLKNDAAVNYQILKKLKYPMKGVTKINPAFKTMLRKSSLLVDAIFGVGLSREVKDPFLSVIRAMNESETKILAVDIPSGLDGTTGKIYGVCVKACTTVTFSFAKTGFTKNEGLRFSGKVKVVDIGIPIKLMEKVKRI